MIEKILAAVFVFIKSVIGLTGYGGIAILMAIESACIPLPSELIMPFAGYLVYEGTMNLFWVATAGAIGCITEIGGGSRSMIAAIRLVLVLPSNARRPVIIS